MRIGSLHTDMPVVESGNAGEQSSDRDLQGASTRRRFLGFLGGGSTLIAGSPRTAAARAPPSVAMGNDYFDPIGLHVDTGASVRFVIEAGSHSTTAYEERIPADAAPFDSGTISDGGFEHTFETPGTYDLYCRPHRSMGMVGRVVVDEPGGPAEAAPIPDGDVPDSDTIVKEGAVSIDEFDEAGGSRRRGTMDERPMTNGSGPGRMMLVPAGFLTGVFGLLGGTLYWTARRTDSKGSDSDAGLSALEEQYLRGDLSEAEFIDRRKKLEVGEGE